MPVNCCRVMTVPPYTFDSIARNPSGVVLGQSLEIDAIVFEEPTALTTSQTLSIR